MCREVLAQGKCGLERGRSSSSRLGATRLGCGRGRRPRHSSGFRSLVVGDGGFRSEDRRSRDLMVFYMTRLAAICVSFIDFPVDHYDLCLWGFNVIQINVLLDGVCVVIMWSATGLVLDTNRLRQNLYLPEWDPGFTWESSNWLDIIPWEYSKDLLRSTTSSPSQPQNIQKTKKLKQNTVFKNCNTHKSSENI